MIVFAIPLGYTGIFKNVYFMFYLLHVQIYMPCSDAIGKQWGTDLSFPQQDFMLFQLLFKTMIYFLKNIYHNLLVFIKEVTQRENLRLLPWYCMGKTCYPPTVFNFISSNTGPTDKEIEPSMLVNFGKRNLTLFSSVYFVEIV